MNSNMPEQINYIIMLLMIFKDVLLGFVGGIVSYLFEIKKSEKDKVSLEFKFGGMILNASLGMFVGYIVGVMLPETTVGRNAIIGLSGFASYPILILAESKFAIYIISKFTNTKKDV